MKTVRRHSRRKHSGSPELVQIPVADPAPSGENTIIITNWRGMGVMRRRLREIQREPYDDVPTMSRISQTWFRRSARSRTP